MVTFLAPALVVPTVYSGAPLLGALTQRRWLDLELVDNFEQLFDRAVRLCQLAVELLVFCFCSSTICSFQADLGGGIGGLGSLAFCRSVLVAALAIGVPGGVPGRSVQSSPQVLKHTVVRSQ